MTTETLGMDIEAMKQHLIKLTEELFVAPEEEHEFEEDNYLSFYDRIQILEQQMRWCLDSFFRGKQYFCGGPVPKKELYHDRSFRLLSIVDFDETLVGIIYRHCVPKLLNVKTKLISTIKKRIDIDLDGISNNYAIFKDGDFCDLEIVLLTSLLNEFWELGIPREFYGGLIVRYFELCYGISLKEFY